MTSAEVAELLGVGPTSVKRWADSGLLPCLRTPGRHRRFARPEVERFRKSQRETHEPDPAQVDAWLRLLQSECGPYEVHSALLFDRSRYGAWWRVAELQAAVLAELGRRWERGEISVVAEHQASERLDRGLARCVEAIAVPTTARRAFLASAVGDEHTLGLQLAEMCLRESGWSALWGGRGLPTAELVAKVEQGDCELVALSASASLQDAAALRDQLVLVGSVCAAREARLVVGGNGAWPEPGPSLPAFSRVRNFRELHELLESFDG